MVYWSESIISLFPMPLPPEFSGIVLFVLYICLWNLNLRRICKGKLSRKDYRYIEVSVTLGHGLTAGP